MHHDAIPAATPITVAHALLGRSRRMLILTGAGVSVASGMATFRGLAAGPVGDQAWARVTVEGFRRDPCTVWRWYADRRRAALAATPNPAHRAIAAWMLRSPRTILVTQNVDGLHQRAAREVGDVTAPDRTIALHGSLFAQRCVDCAKPAPDPGEIDASQVVTLPHCNRCGGLVRPGVVWYGEHVDSADAHRIFRASALAHVCLVVGTSLDVYPAASCPSTTLAAGGWVIEVNPEPAMDENLRVVRIAADAAVAVPEILAPPFGLRPGPDGVDHG